MVAVTVPLAQSLLFFSFLFPRLDILIGGYLLDREYNFIYLLDQAVTKGS